MQTPGTATPGVAASPTPASTPIDIDSLKKALTNDDKKVIAAIFGEVGTRPSLEQQVVAFTLVNRLKHEQYKNRGTLLGVVTQPGQYGAYKPEVEGSPYSTAFEYLDTGVHPSGGEGSMRRTNDLVLTVMPILRGEVTDDFTHGATHFFHTGGKDTHASFYLKHPENFEIIKIPGIKDTEMKIYRRLEN